jgi:hypothetical protein
VSTLRDWRPGDGITCQFAKRAAIPCGQPVKSRVITMEQLRRAPRTVVQPLCANHAARDVREEPNFSISGRIRKVATERLIAEHFEEYQRFLREAAAAEAAEAKAIVEGGGPRG